MKKDSLIIFCILLSISSFNYGQSINTNWTKKRAEEWYAQQAWLRGCNFIPSNAVNQLEMWQAETFDSATINRELGFAESIGFNCMRVFLHHLAWQTDERGFKDRMNVYLKIASGHHISTIFVFFDDCWNENYKAGRQPDPKPGIHNSGWVRDPGKLLEDDSSLMSLLKKYVKDVMASFKKDKRILMWDLYNEPGNSAYKNRSLLLLAKVFEWGREVNPDQPLTAGLWDAALPDLNAFQLSHSDIITYHSYEDEIKHSIAIDSLKKYGRPLICTEYMARLRHSTFFNIMPLLKSLKIGAINWGLVSGKTNTIYAWDEPMPDGSEPKIWFHDIFRKDGTAFRKEETDFIKLLTGKQSDNP
ncbi:MAG TPA: hypothetical protein VMT76_02295 [Puia sp.]|nr:hypothetical protein [Puia sp.]